jgi:hypothetical protein
MKTIIKIILILPLVVLFIIYFITKVCFCKATSKATSKSTSKANNTKGICYFDIDGTLTTANGDRDEMIQECLNNNFAVGIITASPRKVIDICNGDKAVDNWMSNLLCKQFQENNAKMYNSTTQLAGSTSFPDGYNNIQNKNQGYVKGWQMKYGRDKFYKDIPDKCIVLFDDQQPVMDAVKDFDKNLEVQCSGYDSSQGTCTTLGKVLDLNTIKTKIKKMQANGCI